MNSASSLNKYAERDNDYTAAAPWRVVRHSEGLQFVATAMLAANPTDLLSHLRVRVNLGMSDASLARTNHIKQFFKALKTYKHCKFLDLAHCQITDHTCREHLEPMLQSNTFLESLVLADNAFSDTGASMIFTALHNTKISTLDMSENGITSGIMDAAIPVILRDQFKKLELSRTDIGAQGVKLMGPALENLTQLSILGLEAIKLGDEGCLELSSRFAKDGKMASITDLNIQENNIGRVGIEKLVENFVPGKNETLVKLNISKNYFGDEGFDFVIDMMNRNLTMNTLKINKIGITHPKFVTFCEKMLVRYQQEFGPYPSLSLLEVGNNGLGNEIDALTDMISHKNCVIAGLGYDSNDLTNFGAKKVKEWLTKKFTCRTIVDKDSVEDTATAKLLKTKNNKKECVTKEFTCNRRAIVDEVLAEDTATAKLLKEENTKRRVNFEKLTLKGNQISEDGAESLAEIVKSNTIFNELDLRKNKIGVKGAIFFKKAFRARQCKQAKFDTVNTTFKFHILPEDVTVEGVNHLAIGMREHPTRFQQWINHKKQREKYEYLHNYARPAALQKLWDTATGKATSTSTTAEAKSEEGKDFLSNGPTTKDMFAPLESLLRKHPVESKLRHHLSHVGTKFKEFDTPSVTSTNKADVRQFKYGIHIYGENDEKEDQFEFLTNATYGSGGVSENERGVYKWNNGQWKAIKNGWGCTVANTLYRYGMMLRMRYDVETDNFVRDLYLKRYHHGGMINFMKKMDTLKRDQLVMRLVSDDIKEFWEVLMHQTGVKSEGLTMLEFVLKYAESPVIDCIRQFLNVFPAQAYQRKGSKTPATFLAQTIAHSGKTYRYLCLESKDKFVRRYAEAKKLFLFRFLEVEPIYVSKFTKVSKVEDLLLTEEYDDSERFFYMRRIAETSAQNDENLAKNEFEAHKSFMADEKSYLSGDVTSVDNIDNIILKNVNAALDADFLSQVSQLHNRKQLLTDDCLVPTFTNIYKTNLREVLDNESLAGGRDLARAQIMMKMIANSLDHFNNRKWASGFDSVPDIVKKNRCHGNVKPRNVILRVADELPDLDKAIGFLPGKWVLSDFCRSTAHGDDYYPAKDSAYNPPEVAKRLMSSGEAHLKQRIEASEKIDVWQFGCVLFEVLSGTTLFKMEGNNDLIIDEDERGELINWLTLDEERAELILNQLRANRGAGSQSYKNSNISMSLNNWGGYDDEQLEKVIESGKQLVQRCLQGRPEDRPTFAEILMHPFLKEVNIGRHNAEDDAENLLPIPDSSWDSEGYLKNQPHVHLINTEFEQAGLVVKSLEHSLGDIGCRITTDSISNVSAAEYNAQVKKSVQGARIIACLLTRDAFFKPNVVKQLLFAEDYRKKSDKPHSRILFIDLSKGLDLSKDNMTFDKKKFTAEWTQSDEFQYLVKALAIEDPSLSSFGLGQINYDDKFDAWNKFLTSQYKAMVLSYLQEPITYESESFLREPMLDRMLSNGHLVPSSKIGEFSVSSPSSKNYKDPTDLLNKKMKDRKDKFMNLYFLPANKVRKGDIRVYVLSSKSGTEEDRCAVSEITRALETPRDDYQVAEENKHKESTDPRNRLFNKVKTSYNIKKDSHLKVGGRTKTVQNIKDGVMNVTREEGALLIVLYCTDGVFKKYSKFLHEAVDKRGDKFALVLVKGFEFNIGSAKQEIEQNVPEQLKAKFLDKSSYIPYFKPKKDPWQYDAAMEQIVKVASHKIVHPTPKENFAEIDMSSSS